ncbi:MULTISPECIES: GNAT family N-acetyltransferase [unclassified Thioalkalivibrio]|uniref:GNAT family N-acetyltransferase n=1 Tax=unclassified Thioalkalivibrio TaxID=2621013 RepID=UPI00036EF90A|nr:MULTISPECIES: GNAT family N-acetyltransferase [unclassified Thioalkalivibrio]
MNFTMERGTGLEPHLEAIARLRIEVFREWPYLYEGSVEYERDYLADYVRCPQSAVVLAWDGDELVGASTSLPLAAADADFQAPFVQNGLDPERYFYLAESVLRRSCRGQGAGHRFFDAREAAARESGYTQATFCAVIRPDDHPARPAGYRPLDGFWRKRGYEPAEGLVCHYHWPDLGEEEETWKPLQFWWRSL